MSDRSNDRPRALTPEEIESLREEMQRDGQRMADRLRQEKPLSGVNMDFRRANDIVDRLAAALASDRFVDRIYIAIEWIGTESRDDVMRALFLVLAEHYQAMYPLRADSSEFDEFAVLIGGGVAAVQTRVFPMALIAPLANAERHTRVYSDAFDAVHQCALVEMQRWESADTFAAWLKKLDPTFDDYVAMVNDHITHKNGLAAGDSLEVWQ